MKVFSSLLLVLASTICQAQWQASAGINFAPLIARSVELNSEFMKHPGYALNLNIGGTFNTGHVGLIDFKKYDGVTNRRTSGAFVKAGGKLYPSGLSGKQRRNNFYVGALVIVSQYKQSALKREFQNGEFSDISIPSSVEGVTAFPAISFGFVHNISRQLILDWGVQKSFVIRKDDYLGTKMRNYQPGGGSHQSDPFIGYLQGILSLKYRFASRE